MNIMIFLRRMAMYCHAQSDDLIFCVLLMLTSAAARSNISIVYSFLHRHHRGVTSQHAFTFCFGAIAEQHHQFHDQDFITGLGAVV